MLHGFMSGPAPPRQHTGAGRERRRRSPARAVMKRSSAAAQGAVRAGTKHGTAGRQRRRNDLDLDLPQTRGRSGGEGKWNSVATESERAPDARVARGEREKERARPRGHAHERVDSFELPAARPHSAAAQRAPELEGRCFA